MVNIERMSLFTRCHLLANGKNQSVKSKKNRDCPGCRPTGFQKPGVPSKIKDQLIFGLWAIDYRRTRSTRLTSVQPSASVCLCVLS